MQQNPIRFREPTGYFVEFPVEEDCVKGFVSRGAMRSDMCPPLSTCASRRTCFLRELA